MTSIKSIWIVLASIVLVSEVLSAADWIVVNDHKQAFTIYVSPTNNPNSIATRLVPAGKTRPIPLGADPHDVRAYSGGAKYGLKSTDLRNVTTKLSVIWTERRRRRNGRRMYDYMNQQGFFELDQPDNRLDQSIWTTTYKTPNGGTHTTDLKFAGTSGSYDRGHGKLSNVTYTTERGIVVIRGVWKHSGNQGRFEFFRHRRDTFTSAANGERGIWWGHLAYRP